MIFLNVLFLILSFILFSIADYFIIKFEIKQNKYLFYDLHRREIIVVLSKEFHEDLK